MIRQCRASDLTKQSWCEQKDISLKNYYYLIAKIWKLALEELHQKSHGCRSSIVQIVLMTDTASEFTEVSLRGKQNFSAVFHTGTATVELFEDTSCELLETIVKAVRSC